MAHEAEIQNLTTSNEGLQTELTYVILSLANLTVVGDNNRRMQHSDSMQPAYKQI